MKEQNFLYFLFASSLIHMATFPAVSAIMPTSPFKLGQNLIPIELIHVPGRQEKIEPAVVSKRSSTTATKFLKSTTQKASAPQPVMPAATAKAEELEVKKDEREERLASFSSGSSSALELGAALQSGAGAGDSPVNGDMAAGAANAMARTGAGNGREASASGAAERLFRAAKPLQTAKAAYPPMALRMGLQADVTLKIFVDSEGKVTKVEILKTAGMGFDEEAVRTVRQFRFEPAKKDGVSVPSEFTYIYKFRLEK